MEGNEESRKRRDNVLQDMKQIYERIRVFEKGDRVLTSLGWGIVEYDNYYELGQDRFYNCSSFSHIVMVKLDKNNKIKEFMSTVIFSEDEYNAK